MGTSHLIVSTLIHVLFSTYLSHYVSSASYEWIKINDKTPLPMNALLGGSGHDEGGDKKPYLLYIGRAYHGNELIPGKVADLGRLNGVFWALHEKTEHEKSSYEILVGDDEFAWKKMNSYSIIPNNVIKGGHKSDDTPYYIGRAKYNGRDNIIGKVDGSNKILYTSKGDIGKTFSSYEILVWDDHSSCIIEGSVG